MLRTLACSLALSFAALTAHAQSTSGTMLILPANGDVTHVNDEAHATLTIEEQDKDKGAAASRVNLKMKQGVEIIKRADPAAILKTRGYYTFAIYADEPNRPASKPRLLTGWRVGQYLDVSTTNLDALPKAIAAVQPVLALNGLQFGLSPATAKRLDQQRIEATYKNLQERLAIIARTMGRAPADAVIETIDFEASGAYAQQEGVMLKGARSAMAPQAAPVEEPGFEPGETTLSMRVVAKVRFK
jgi:predicted secreted protein